MIMMLLSFIFFFQFSRWCVFTGATRSLVTWFRTLTSITGARVSRRQTQTSSTRTTRTRPETRPRGQREHSSKREKSSCQDRYTPTLRFRGKMGRSIWVIQIENHVIKWHSESDKSEAKGWRSCTWGSREGGFPRGPNILGSRPLLGNTKATILIKYIFFIKNRMIYPRTFWKSRCQAIALTGVQRGWKSTELEAGN